MKSVMTLDPVRWCMCELFRRPAVKVKAADRRVLVRMLLLFFGMKGFNDIKRLRVCDINVWRGGHLEFCVESPKTDQLGKEFIFHVTGESLKGFQSQKY